MTTFTTNVHPTGRRHVARPSFWQWLIAAFAARRQRARLSQLPPHLLKDIGLSQEEADREAKRGMWDVPEHWLQ